jgi:hypothetical protein
VRFNIGGEPAGGPVAALKAFRRTLEIDQGIYGARSIKLLPDLVALGVGELAALDAEQGDEARLQDICTDIRSIHRSLPDPSEANHANRAAEHNVLAACHLERKETESALSEHFIAAEILEARLPEAKENVSEYIETLGYIAGVVEASKQASASECARLRRGTQVAACHGAAANALDELSSAIQSACPKK